MLEGAICRVLDWDSSWWGLRSHKPTPDRPYSSRTLLLVCLVQGLPMALMVYFIGYGASAWVRSVNSLTDDTTWFPRSLALGYFVANMLLQAICCWAWNRRCARLAPGAFRYGNRRV